MSAIVDKAPHAFAQFDGLRRYQTRIKAIVHSHNNKTPIYLSDDVISCTVAKNVKGTGQANLAMVANRAYINMLFPNDVVNIYFNRGDGEGWTRTFFGYVDRIEEEYSVDSNGQPSTLYHLIASDFQKAVERTEIYFNPHLNGRQDMDGTSFSVVNIGPQTMLMRGLTFKGSPADLVINLLMLQLGFGSQWILPGSYKPRLTEELVRKRQEYASGRLMQALNRQLTPDQAIRLKELVDVGDIERIRQESIVPVSTRVGGVNDNENDIFASSRQFTENLSREIRGDSTDPLNIQAGVLAQYFSSFAVESGYTGTSLLDVVDVLSFVERKAIDGWAVDLALWEQQGSLMNILKSISNEVVCEVLFDLRPVQVSGQLEEGTDWDRTPDDAGGNLVDDSDSSDTNVGIRYVPALVMREYPFGTVHKIDASNVQLRGISASQSNANPFGEIPIGAVFSNKPNEPGRHLVNFPVIAWEDVAGDYESGTKTKKHIDVAVISETEIQSSRFGRSDDDHFNLMELTTQSPLGDSERFFMKDFLPVVTPIHIMRNGLRVRSVFSRFGFLSGSGNDTPIATNTPQQGAPTEDDQPYSTDVVPPVRGGVPRFWNQRSGSWGYRPKLPPSSVGNNWVFHYGIDISGKEAVTEVVAIADGDIVCSAKSGTRGLARYGDTVVIYHPQFSGPEGQKIYSMYNHLASRDFGIQELRTLRECAARGHHPQGREFEPIRVDKGTRIGFLGRTAGTPAQPDNVFGGAHLHFEIDYVWPPRRPGQTPMIPFEQLPNVTSAGQAYEAAKLEAISLAQALGGTGVPTTNEDPAAWFQDKAGISLEQAIRGLAGTNNPGEIEVDEGGDGSTEPETGLARETANVDPDEATAVAAAAGTSGARPRPIDTNERRKQLARWSLLQDHWYQHNLEYLSGQIVMRGAPEIRVGYRLDILERNMSCYVESVQHSWQFPNEMTTTLQVTRGQPNNPFPAYALPPTDGFGARQASRRATSRLAKYFLVPDPIAIRRGIAIRANRAENAMVGNTYAENRPDDTTNLMDVPDLWEDHFNYGELPDGLLPANMENDEEVYTSNIKDESLVIGDSLEGEQALNSLDDFLDDFDSENNTIAGAVGTDIPATPQGKAR